jgi:transposase, IS30 family
MGKKYSQISDYERNGIASGILSGLGPRAIGRLLGRPASCISREISRNSSHNKYESSHAQKKAERRASIPRCEAKLHENELRSYVFDMLKSKLSPSQISGRLKLEYADNESMQASAETIYRYLYVMPKGELRTEVLGYLRQSRKMRRPRSRGNDRRGCITNMSLIKDRPAEVEERLAPGHWEGDLIKGKGNASSIGTLVERSTRYTLLIKLKSADAKSALAGFAKALKRMPAHFRETMTYDRGKEMALHEKLTKKTGTKVFFADPHCPWQRGTNENTNGLIRQYFPKGMDLSTVTQRQLTKAENELNSRPRKVHGFYTPAEVLKAKLTGKPVALGV